MSLSNAIGLRIGALLLQCNNDIDFGKVKAWHVILCKASEQYQKLEEQVQVQVSKQIYVYVNCFIPSSDYLYYTVENISVLYINMSETFWN